MEKFFVNKTGFEMFDAFRAYGLGFLLKGIEREDLKLTINDVNYAFVLDLEGKTPSTPDAQIFVEIEDKWQRVFRTYRERKDARGKPPKEEVKNILFDEFNEIIKVHHDLCYSPQIGASIKGGKTLYQSLDVSAAKGFREQKLGLTYHEGTQLEVDKHSWALACLGAACVGTWQSGRDFEASLVPNPVKVSVDSHRTIQKDLKEERLCNLSALTALTHYGVKLTERIARRKEGRSLIYDSVIFNVMRKTGQQLKPGGGGKYGLTFLSKLADEPYGVEALNRIDGIFKAGFVKGIKQDLAFAFGNFLLYPNLENFRRCEDLNIRGQIDENVIPWDKAQMEAMLRHVEVT